MRVRNSLLLGFSLLALAVYGCANGAPVPGFENLGGEGQGGDGSGAGTTSSTTSSTTNSTSNTTTSSSTTTSSTTSSTTGSTTSSTSSGFMCDDTGVEPNDTESTAVDLGSIGDPDGDGATFTGLVEGQSDKDWFKYKGSDETITVVDPTRDVTSSDAIRVCKYAQCLSGNTVVDCPSGTNTATSPDGRSGCCSDHGFTIDLNCTGTVSDDATIYIRIDSQVQACVTYSVDYHY